jgi:hypothetical protein
VGGIAGSESTSSWQHVIGAALTTVVVKFTGDSDQNWDEWLQGFEWMA